MFYDVGVDFSTLAIAFLVSTFASTYGSSAGGSALLVLPVLIFLGVPAQHAVATAFLGYMGMNIMGVYRFGRANKVEYRLAIWVGIAMAIGTVLGTFLLPTLTNAYLEVLIGWFILVILLLVLLTKKVGLVHRECSATLKSVGYILSGITGVYLATIMAGTSILATYILMFFFGQTYLESAGTRKLVFMLTNSVGLVLYALQGLILWPLGLALVLGNALGCYIGVEYALKKGDNWVKWLFVLTTSLSALKLIV